MENRLALVFSRPTTSDPLSFMGEKRCVYEELMQRLQNKNIYPFITTTKVYSQKGEFKGYWDYSKGEKVEFINKKIKVDIVYDRSAGLDFPQHKDDLRVVDNREFKILAWDKWLVYKQIGEFMPKTYFISNNLKSLLSKINSDFVVIKPINGLKGKDLFIGSKKDAICYDMNKEKSYIVCEFIETVKGIPGIVEGRHDLRVVIINNKIVWSHVRTPPNGAFKANVAQGGKLVEVEVKDLPENIIKTAMKVSEVFFKDYDNPIYSLDFGLDNKGKVFIFEINDQIGFPKPFMKAKDIFLEELVENFKSKL